MLVGNERETVGLFFLLLNQQGQEFHWLLETETYGWWGVFFLDCGMDRGGGNCIKNVNKIARSNRNEVHPIFVEASSLPFFSVQLKMEWFSIVLTIHSG